MKIHNYRDKLCIMGKNIEEMTNLAYEAIKYDKFELGEIAEKLLSVVANQESEMLLELIRISKDNPDNEVQTQVKVLVSITSHLKKVSDNIENILRCIKVKLEKNTLFSNKALQECKFLFETLQYLLRCIKDSITTGNRVLTEYVMETASTLEESANKFATEHEDRLVKGICRPEASSIYVEILDSLKNMSWHIKSVAERIHNHPWEE